ncbi:MAG: polysaccharide biosynthesis/export family protein [Bacteroidota bacterium]
MFTFKKNNYLWYFLLPVLLFSCTPQKRLTYFQDKEGNMNSIPIDTTYNAFICPNDILTIYVASVSEEASKFFNFSSNQDDGTSLVNGFVVDHFGNIQMPLVGNVHVGGLTTSDARDRVIEKLSKYLVNPTVKLNIRNFRVTILGEVASPGVYPVLNEKITLTEALALAGDISPYGLRENIMIIREINDKKEFGFVDITSRQFFSSAYYNLRTNDIIYVESAKRKRIFTENYSRVLSWITIPLSAGYLIYRIIQPN